MSISFSFQGALDLYRGQRLLVSYNRIIIFTLVKRTGTMKFELTETSDELMTLLISVLRKQMPVSFLADFIDENIIPHKGSHEDWARLTNFMRDYDKQQIREIGWNKTVLPNDQWINGESPTAEITITPNNPSNIIHGTN